MSTSRTLRENLGKKQLPPTNKKAPSESPPSKNDNSPHGKTNDRDRADEEATATNATHEDGGHDESSDQKFHNQPTEQPSSFPFASFEPTLRVVVADDEAIQRSPVQIGSTNKATPTMTAAAGATQSNTATSSSSSSSLGSIVGYAVGVMMLVLVLFYFAKKHSGQSMKHELRPMRNKNRTKAMNKGVPSQEERPTVMVQEDEDDEGDGQKGSFTGVYKLVEHSQWNTFLQVLGVSWAVRSATVRTKPVQFVTHEGNAIIIKFKGVPRVTYNLDGSTVMNVVNSQSFACTARYTKDSDGFEVHKEALSGDMNLHLRWSLLDDNETVRMSLTAIFSEDETREPIQCTQIYQRIGEF